MGNTITVIAHPTLATNGHIQSLQQQKERLKIMNLYHCECAELNCLNVFAIDKDRAEFLVKVYLEFNYAEHVKYKLGNVIDPMHLDRKSREFLMGALARNSEGFGVFVEERGWMIAPMWKYPFNAKSE